MFFYPFRIPFPQLKLNGYFRIIQNIIFIYKIDKLFV